MLVASNALHYVAVVVVVGNQFSTYTTGITQ